MKKIEEAKTTFSNNILSLGKNTFVNNKKIGRNSWGKSTTCLKMLLNRRLKLSRRFQKKNHRLEAFSIENRRLTIIQSKKL